MTSEPVTLEAMKRLLEGREPPGGSEGSRELVDTLDASDLHRQVREAIRSTAPHCWYSVPFASRSGIRHVVAASADQPGYPATLVSATPAVVEIRRADGTVRWVGSPVAHRLTGLESVGFLELPTWWQAALRSEAAERASRGVDGAGHSTSDRCFELVAFQWSREFTSGIALVDADLARVLEVHAPVTTPEPHPDHVPSGGRGVADVERRWSCVFETKSPLGDDRTVLEVISRARDGTDRSPPTNSGRDTAADWAQWGSAIADGVETVLISGLEEYGTIDQRAFRHPDGSWLLATDTGGGVDVSAGVTGTEMCELVGDCVGGLPSDRPVAQHRLSLRDLSLVALVADRRASRGADRAQVAAVWPSRAAPRALSGSWTDIVAATLTAPALADAEPPDALFGFVDGALAATLRGATLAASLAPPDRWISLRNDDRSMVVVAAGDDVWVIDSHHEGPSVALIRATPAVLDAALAGWFRVGEI